jgi:hypothetical protein
VINLKTLLRGTALESSLHPPTKNGFFLKQNGGHHFELLKSCCFLNVSANASIAFCFYFHFADFFFCFFNLLFEFFFLLFEVCFVFSFGFAF